MSSRTVPRLPGPDLLLTATASRSSRWLVRDLAERASAAVDRIDDEGRAGVEARHDLRVALRQLRTTTEAYAAPLEGLDPTRVVRKARALARRIGRVRDADVQRMLLHSVAVARTAPQRAALERLEVLRGTPTPSELDTAAIRRRWAKLASRLHEGTTRWHEEHRIDDTHDAPRFSHAAADALIHAAHALAECCTAFSTAEDIAALHATRLAVKRVRYLLKPLAGDDVSIATTLELLRDAQDLLGGINDAAELRTRIRNCRDDTPAISRITRAALDASERDLTHRITRAFATLAPWRDAHAICDATSTLHAIADRWRRGAAPPMEFERKWLLSALPPRVHGVSPATLHQGYLPGESLVERIRSVTEDGHTEWIRTVKLGRGVARIEVEEPTSPSLGKALFALTRGKRVAKRRYAVADGELTWEIDEFTDRELVLAEVEFPDASTAVDFPDWLAPWIVREVTDESGFTNWKLAR